MNRSIIRNYNRSVAAQSFASTAVTYSSNGTVNFNYPQIRFNQEPIPPVQVFLPEEPIQSAHIQKPKKTIHYDLDKNLTLDVKAQRKTIKLDSTKDQSIPFLINVKTSDFVIEQTEERSPIDLICIVDHSGSMAGDAIRLVKETLSNILEFTNKEDRICLIQFDDYAEQLTPLQRNSPQNLESFISKINSIEARGGTSMTPALELAFKVLSERKTFNPIASIFLLTDGLEQRGDFSTIKSAYTNSNVTNTPFTISCFGFGQNHDQQLLVKIADMKDGGFYYIQELNKINETFASALGGLLSVVAIQTIIKVKPAQLDVPFDQIKISNTYGKKWVKSQTGDYEIKFDQLLAGTQKGFVAELLVPAIDHQLDKKNKNIIVLDIQLTSLDRSGQISIKKQAQLAFALSNPHQINFTEKEDEKVMENYFRVKGATAIERIMQYSNQGDYKAGEEFIQDFIFQVESQKAVNKSTLEPLVGQLRACKTLLDESQYQHSGKKRMTEIKHSMINQMASSTHSAVNHNFIQSSLITRMSPVCLN